MYIFAGLVVLIAMVASILFSFRWFFLSLKIQYSKEHSNNQATQKRKGNAGLLAILFGAIASLVTWIFG